MSDTSARAAPMNVAFLGLGVMGYPMAGHLARAGHHVTVYNRSAGKAAKWVAAYGGHSAATPAAAAKDADLVMMCVGNDDDVHAVAGGQAGAENGKLTVMVGGDAATFARAEPLMTHYGRAVTLMGGPGSGQLTKMVNQICIAGIVQGLSEGIDFAQRAGLDALAVLDVISKGAAQSWQMENRGKTMVEGKFDFGFAVDWMRKDLGICLVEARSNGAALPLAALVDQFYSRVQAMGGGRWDTSSLVKLLRNE